MRHDGRGESSARRQLVVRSDECAWAVEHSDARSLETGELPEADFDSIEVSGHVQPPNRDVPALERQQRFGRSEDPEARPAARRRYVARCPAMSDDRGEHLALSVRSDARFLRRANHLFTGSIQLRDEAAHADGDLVADRANLLERASGWIRQLPVLVALAGNDRALVATAHRHDVVGPLEAGRFEAVRRSPGDLDAELSHHLDDLGMDVLGRPAPGRTRLMLPFGGALEE